MSIRVSTPAGYRPFEHIPHLYPESANNAMAPAMRPLWSTAQQETRSSTRARRWYMVNWAFTKVCEELVLNPVYPVTPTIFDGWEEAEYAALFAVIDGVLTPGRRRMLRDLPRVLQAVLSYLEEHPPTGLMVGSVLTHMRYRFSGYCWRVIATTHNGLVWLGAFRDAPFWLLDPVTCEPMRPVRAIGKEDPREVEFVIFFSDIGRHLTYRSRKPQQ